MAENDKPVPEGNKVDPSENPGDVAPASAQGPGAIGGDDDKGVSEQKKDNDKPGGEASSKTASKGINPVQHSE